MGFSNNILTHPFTKIAANGAGDLQRALGTSSMSQVAMMTGQAGTIKPMAKFKPFRNATAIFASDAARETARRNARYGMNRNYPTLTWTWNSSLGKYVVGAAAYEYQRPDGNNYPLRAMDFIDCEHKTTRGYCSNAKAPIEVILSNVGDTDVYKDGTIVQVRLDDRAYYNVDEIDTDVNLTTEDILQNDASSYHLALLISFGNRGATNSGYCTVVTPWTMEQVRTLQSNWVQILLRGPADLSSGLPGIPLLDDQYNASGQEIVIVACMTNANGPSAGMQYVVYDSTQVPVTSLMSLAFEAGADRIVGYFNAAGSDWSHLYASTLAVSHGALGSPDQYGQYHLSLGAILTLVADSGWSGLAFNVQLIIEGDGELRYNGTSYYGGPLIIPIPSQQHPSSGAVNINVSAGGSRAYNFADSGLGNVDWILPGDMIADLSFRIFAWRGQGADAYANGVDLCNETIRVETP